MYRLQELTASTNLPVVPRESLRSIVEGDSLTRLGIARAGEAPPVKSSQEEEEF